MTKGLYFALGTVVGTGIGSLVTYLALRSRLNTSDDQEYAEEEKSLKTENTASEGYSGTHYIPKNGVKYRDTLEELENIREEIKEDEWRKYEEKTKIYRSLEDDERLKREIDRQIKEVNEVKKENGVIFQKEFDELVKDQGYDWFVIEAHFAGDDFLRFTNENGSAIYENTFCGLDDDVADSALEQDFYVGAFFVNHDIRTCYHILRIDDSDVDVEGMDDPEDEKEEIPDELDDIDNILAEEAGSIPGYTTIGLVYYIPDQIVVYDSDNSEMDDFEEHIGNNAISNFQDRSIKWIRNRREHIDYCIMFCAIHYDPQK